MLALTLYMMTMTPPAAACSQVGPRLDGSYVTVCNGTVVAVRDRSGNSREWNPATRTITVRAPGSPTLVLEALPSIISHVD